MNTFNLFEAELIYWIQEHLRLDFLTPIMQFVTALGNGGSFWILLTILLLAFRRTRRAGLCCALALLLDFLAVNLLLKPLVGRVRPYQIIDEISVLTALPADASFPSGHSAASFAAAWALFRIEGGRRGATALILAGAIALSRLYVGVHYPTDVLFGVAIGMLAAEAALRLFSLSSKKRAGLE